MQGHVFYLHGHSYADECASSVPVRGGLGGIVAVVLWIQQTQHTHKCTLHMLPLAIRITIIVAVTVAITTSDSDSDCDSDTNRER